jgi:hypothetical protein
LTVRLFRAAASEDPYTGPRSFWTSSLPYADFYRRSGIFGGPTIWVAEVEPAEGRTLDLRQDPWPTLRDQAGVDEADYPEGIFGHDLLQDVVKVLEAGGWEWVTFRSFGGTRHAIVDDADDEWWYLGAHPLVVLRLDHS